MVVECPLSPGFNGYSPRHGKEGAVDQPIEITGTQLVERKEQSISRTALRQHLYGCKSWTRGGAMAGKRAHAALQQCTPGIAQSCFPRRTVPSRTRTRKQLFDQGEIDRARKVAGDGARARARARPFAKQQNNNNNNEWRSLGVSTSELSLPLTFVTGQSFRWRSTGPSQYTGVVGSHLVSLRQRADDVAFLLHTGDTDGAAEAELRDYLNLDTSLEKLYEEFAMADVRFADVAPFLVGARLLRQNPLECLYQFICSSNNHIQRISGMVEYLAAHGPRLGTVQGLDFHAFPSLAELANVTEEQLRKAGFGYRSVLVLSSSLFFVLESYVLSNPCPFLLTIPLLSRFTDRNTFP